MSIILDLCGGTGSWSAPYRKAGYRVILVDPYSTALNVLTYDPPVNVHGILAAPPCTEFAVSGARWWKNKPPEKLEHGLAVVMACLRIIEQARPAWWALENPVGRLSQFIGPYRMTFQPWEYGDPWCKRTCLWGTFTPPVKNPVKPDKLLGPWRIAPSLDRRRLRSKTPPHFAKAFFEVNP